MHSEDIKQIQETEKVNDESNKLLVDFSNTVEVDKVFARVFD